MNPAFVALGEGKSSVNSQRRTFHDHLRAKGGSKYLLECHEYHRTGWFGSRYSPVLVKKASCSSNVYFWPSCVHIYPMTDGGL